MLSFVCLNTLAMWSCVLLACSRVSQVIAIASWALHGTVWQMSRGCERSVRVWSSHSSDRLTRWQNLQSDASVWSSPVRALLVREHWASHRSRWLAFRSLRRRHCFARSVPDVLQRCDTGAAVCRGGGDGSLDIGVLGFGRMIGFDGVSFVSSMPIWVKELTHDSFSLLLDTINSKIERVWDSMLRIPVDTTSYH